MTLFTVSNTGFSRLTRNLVASAKRCGLSMKVYVPSPNQRIDGVECEVAGYDCPPCEQSIHGSGGGFARMMEFKLYVASRVHRSAPSLYLDADTAILRDPTPFLQDLKTPIAIQERDCAPRNYGCRFCMGMLYIQARQPWVDALLKFTPGQFSNDEPFINRRIELLYPLLRNRIAKLPHPQFMLGYFRVVPETLIYHANFTQLHGETTKIEEDKIRKLKEEGAWFI